jgi:hypothetical protein
MQAYSTYRPIELIVVYRATENSQLCHDRQNTAALLRHLVSEREVKSTHACERKMQLATARRGTEFEYGIWQRPFLAGYCPLPVFRIT